MANYAGSTRTPRTLTEYHPGFPGRFSDQAAALAHCRTFFPWYNREHRHGGIAMLTPEAVHYGRADEVLAQRQAALDAAYLAHPERFVGGRPLVRPLPPATYINPPKETPTTAEPMAQ